MRPKIGARSIVNPALKVIDPSLKQAITPWYARDMYEVIITIIRKERVRLDHIQFCSGVVMTIH